MKLKVFVSLVFMAGSVALGDVDPFCKWWAQSHADAKNTKDKVYQDCFSASRKDDHCQVQAQHNATSQEEWEDHYYKCMNDQTVTPNPEFQSDAQRHEVCLKESEEKAKEEVAKLPKTTTQDQKDNLYQKILSDTYYECMGGHE